MRFVGVLWWTSVFCVWRQCATDWEHECLQTTDANARQYDNSSAPEAHLLLCASAAGLTLPQLCGRNTAPKTSGGSSRLFSSFKTHRQSAAVVCCSRLARRTTYNSCTPI
jgi:hypothetical protein